MHSHVHVQQKQGTGAPQLRRIGFSYGDILDPCWHPRVSTEVARRREVQRPDRGALSQIVISDIPQQNNKETNSTNKHNAIIRKTSGDRLTMACYTTPHHHEGSRWVREGAELLR